MNIEKLTDKQRAFAEHYAIKHSASKAAIAAGYSEKTARQKGWQLMQEPGVKEYIEHLEKEQLAELGVTKASLVAELKKVAHSNITDYVAFNADGVEMRDSEDLTEDQLAAISEVSCKPSAHGKEIKFKLHSKLDAIGKLAAMLGHNAPEKTESSIVVTDTTLDKTEYSIRKRAVDPKEETNKQ